jgi:uncharacterized membrane protein
MPRFEHAVEVDVPVRQAYDQWTQFEQFPQFMEGVKSVEQLDDKNLRWTAEIGGQERSWTAEITDQTPDMRIAWRSTSGAENAGAVLFSPTGPARTTVTLRIDTEPEGLLELVGDGLGFVERRTKGDLEPFRAHVEKGDRPAEGWRGEMHGNRVIGDDRSR